jgi:GGDEF domain-containing protein
VLAAVGGSPVDRLPRDFPPDGAVRSSDRILITLGPPAETSAWLDLGTVGRREFTPMEAALADAGASVLGVWLAGALQALQHPAHAFAFTLGAQGFEARVQEEVERARRFNLETALLVVHSPEMSRERHVLALAPVAEALRSQVRGSDLVGRLSNGSVAALLVHTSERGAAAVAGRVRQRLAQLGDELGTATPQVGTASYPASGNDAAALVAAAMTDLARQDARPV